MIVIPSVKHTIKSENNLSLSIFSSPSSLSIFASTRDRENSKWWERDGEQKREGAAREMVTKNNKERDLARLGEESEIGNEDGESVRAWRRERTRKGFQCRTK